MLHSICQQIWKTQQWPQDWKRPVFIPIPKKGNAKECSNYCTVALISHASKVMIKILQAVNFQMFKLVLETAEGSGPVAQWITRLTTDQKILETAEEPEIKLPASAGSSKKEESSRKTSIFALLLMPKPLIMLIPIHCGKFWNRWESQTTWQASWEICVQVRKEHLKLDLEQQTGT